jgi:hypothetical protein
LNIREVILCLEKLSEAQNGLRAVVLTLHMFLMDLLDKSFFDRVKLALQFGDILFLACLELFHDLFLSAQLAARAFLLCRGLVQ